jgi:hypothetical protein
MQHRLDPKVWAVSTCLMQHGSWRDVATWAFQWRPSLVKMKPWHHAGVFLVVTIPSHTRANSACWGMPWANGRWCRFAGQSTCASQPFRALTCLTNDD